MDVIQWKLKDGKVINSIPYGPPYNQLMKRFLTGVKLNYSDYSQRPNALFVNDEDSINNIIRYENQRSIAKKVKLARLFGIRGVSLWRLENIPDFKDTSESQLELDIRKEIIERSIKH